MWQVWSGKVRKPDFFVGRARAQNNERSPVFKRLSPKKGRIEFKKGNAIRPHIILLNKGQQ
jgi:hypothetical protein